jgi:hypothetical protein
VSTHEQARDTNPTAQRLLQTISFLPAVVFVAYFMGWIHADAYYRAFNARWLAYHVSNIDLLTRAWQPVYSIGILAALFSPPLRLGLWTLTLVPVAIFVAAASSFLPAQWSGPRTLGLLDDVFAFSVMLAVLGCTANVARNLRAQKPIPGLTWPLLGAVLLFFVAIPGMVGAQRGYRDANPARTRLPIAAVLTRDGRTEKLHALLITNERVYGAKLRPVRAPRRVEAIPWDRVLWVSGPSTSHPGSD